MVQLAMSSEAAADSVSREQARALLGEVLQLLGRNQQVTKVRRVPLPLKEMHHRHEWDVRDQEEEIKSCLCHAQADVGSPSHQTKSVLAESILK